MGVYRTVCQSAYLWIPMLHSVVSITSTNFDCRPNGCCDQHEFCPFWARTQECQTNGRWMMPNCQISCNSCTSPAETNSCADRHENCQFWASVGECQANIRWMHPNCPRVCNTCGQQTQTGPVVNPMPVMPMPAPPPVAPAVAVQSGEPVCPREDPSFHQSISSNDVFDSSSMFNCAPQQQGVNCGPNSCFNRRYRTMDGTCNNPGNPTFGAAATPYLRLRPAQFDDGFAAPVSSLRGGRPSARDASRLILASGQLFTDGRFSAMLMQFGQFLVHDISKCALLPTSKCSGCTGANDVCFSINVDQSDPRFGCGGGFPCCKTFTRASPVCGMQPRSNLNENTAFVDGSQIYGSSIPDSQRLRDGSGGLRTSLFNGQSFPPFNQDQCFGPGQCNANFDAGDNRITLFIGLTALHTIFLREHNRLVQQLRFRNPGWDGERLFQEARKIVGAELQSIVYKEYLPKILGASLGADPGFSSGGNPSIAAEFSFGAMRFGHGMLQEALNRVTADGRSFAAPFADDVLKPHKLLFEGGVDPLLKGLLATPVKKPQRLTIAVTQSMFGSEDLGAINIQRGRDAGVPSYNDMRQFCGLSRAQTMEDFSREISDPSIRTSLQRMYSSPDTVDLYVGILVEDSAGGLTGPTAACLIRDQFTRLREGDRLFFEHPGVFTSGQLAELGKVSFSRILCDNADSLQFVNRDAFDLSSGQVPCNSIPSIDLSQWAG